MSEAQSTSAPRRHPLLTILRWFGLAFVCYLLLLGPFRALERRGVVKFPEVVDSLVWAPADVLLNVPVAKHMLIAYFRLWYVDPNGPC